MKKWSSDPKPNFQMVTTDYQRTTRYMSHFAPSRQDLIKAMERSQAALVRMEGAAKDLSEKQTELSKVYLSVLVKSFKAEPKGGASGS